MDGGQNQMDDYYNQIDDSASQQIMTKKNVEAIEDMEDGEQVDQYFTMVLQTIAK